MPLSVKMAAFQKARCSMAARKPKKASKRRVYCDANLFLAKAEAEFARCNDREGGWLLLESLWRFLFSHCIYWKCVPHEIAYYSAGRGDNRCVESMLREQAAMRRELLRSGGIGSRSFARLFAAMAGTAADCARGKLKDDRHLDGTASYFFGTCEYQRQSEGDIRQPRSTYKGNWTIRDSRKKCRRRKAGGRV